MLQLAFENVSGLSFLPLQWQDINYEKELLNKLSKVIGNCSANKATQKYVDN